MNRKREFVTLIGSKSTAWRAINAIRVMRSISNGQVIVFDKGSTGREYIKKCSKS